MSAGPEEKHERDEGRDLAEREQPAPMASAAARELAAAMPRACPPSASANAGRRTSASTITRSSTISQPTAMRPLGVSSRLRSLERPQQHDRAGDRKRESEDEAGAQAPAPAEARARRRSAWRGRSGARAPGMAMPRTASRSVSEKCRPTPNIRRMTPISASWLARSASATKPGVKGPTPRRRGDSRRAEAGVALGHEAAKERQHQPHGDRGDERDVVGHVPPCSWRRGAFIPPAGVFCLRCGARNAPSRFHVEPFTPMSCDTRLIRQYDLLIGD